MTSLLYEFAKTKRENKLLPWISFGGAASLWVGWACFLQNAREYQYIIKWEDSKYVNEQLVTYKRTDAREYQYIKWDSSKYANEQRVTYIRSDGFRRSTDFNFLPFPLILFFWGFNL